MSNVRMCRCFLAFLIPFKFSLEMNLGSCAYTIRRVRQRLLTTGNRPRTRCVTVFSPTIQQIRCCRTALNSRKFKSATLTVLCTNTATLGRFSSWQPLSLRSALGAVPAQLASLLWMASTLQAVRVNRTLCYFSVLSFFQEYILTTPQSSAA